MSPRSLRGLFRRCPQAVPRRSCAAAHFAVAKALGMAERTVALVTEGRCRHCGMKHEAWVAVCPVTGRPITGAEGAPRPPVEDRAAVKGQPRQAIPPAPAIPSAR